MHIIAGVVTFLLLVALFINIVRAANHSKYEKKLENSALMQDFLAEIRNDLQDVKMISIRNRSITVDRFSGNDYDYQFDLQTRQMTKSEMKIIADVCCRTFGKEVLVYPYEGGEYLITIKSRAYAEKLNEVEKTQELKNPFF
jgi:hypothetical protein